MAFVCVRLGDRLTGRQAARRSCVRAESNFASIDVSRQGSYLRFPGIILGVDEPPFPPLLKLIADQLKVGVESWDEYGQREQTRREHLIELQTVFGFQTFTMRHCRRRHIR